MAHEREQEAISLWRREQGIKLTRRKSGSKARVTRTATLLDNVLVTLLALSGS